MALGRGDPAAQPHMAHMRMTLGRGDPAAQPHRTRIGAAWARGPTAASSRCCPPRMGLCSARRARRHGAAFLYLVWLSSMVHCRMAVRCPLDPLGRGGQPSNISGGVSSDRIIRIFTNASRRATWRRSFISNFNFSASLIRCRWTSTESRVQASFVLYVGLATRPAAPRRAPPSRLAKNAFALCELPTATRMPHAPACPRPPTRVCSSAPRSPSVSVASVSPRPHAPPSQ